MWRICNCSQLQPIFGGCKRCQLPTELNHNYRSKGFTRSQPPSNNDSGKNPTEQEQTTDPEAQFQSRIAQSRQNSSKCQLRERNSSSEASLVRKPGIYSNSNLPAARKTDFYNKMNFPRKRIPIKSSWYGGSKKFMDRLKQLLYEPKNSPSQSQSEEFYDCDEPSTSKSGLFTNSDNVSKKPLGIEEDLKPQEIGVKCSEAANCKPLGTPSSGCIMKPTQTITMPTIDELPFEQRPGNIRSTDFEVRQNTDPFPKNPGCITCATKSKPQKPNAIPVISRCARCGAKKTEPIKPIAVCCEVNSVPSSSKSIKCVPKSEPPADCGIPALGSKPEPNSKSARGFEQAATELDTLKSCLKNNTPCCRVESLPDCQHPLPKAAEKNKKNVTPRPTSPIYPPQKPAINTTNNLNNPVIETYTATRKGHTKDNAIFLKLKAMPFYDDIISRSVRKSNPDHKLLQPQTCMQKPSVQPYSKEPPISHSELSNEEELFAETNKLFSNVKKTSSELWGLQPPSRKLEAALDDLRRWEKLIGYSTSTPPMQARFSPRKEKELERLTKYANDMQKRNHMRNQRRQLGMEQTPEKVLELERRHKELPKTKVFTEKKSPEANFEPKPNRKPFIDPAKHYTGKYTKEELQDLRPHKQIRIRKIQQNEKSPSVGLSDEKMKSYADSWRKHQQNISQKRENKQQEKKQNQQANELQKRQVQVGALERTCKANSVNVEESDIDYINSEVTQIDNIIKHCEMLKTKYALRLQNKCAQTLQRKFNRNTGEMHTAGSMLQKKCLEAIGKQKDGTRKKQFVFERLKKFIEDEEKKSWATTSSSSVTERRNKEEEILRKCKAEFKPQNKDTFEKLCQTAISKDTKSQVTDRKKNEADISNSSWEAILWKRCKDAELKIKEAEALKKCQMNAEKKKCLEADRKRKEMELHKSHELEIKRKKAEIAKLYDEAKKRVLELKKELEKKSCPEQEPNKNSQQKGKNSDNDNGLNKYIISPWHRHNDGVFVTPTIFPRGHLDIGRHLLAPHNPRGIVDTGGFLDALGITFTRRLDSKFYLSDLQNRLALADISQRRHLAVLPYEDETTTDSERTDQNISLIIQWMRKFAELPLQLRPGSNILLPLPHSKGGYLIGESEPHSSLKWPDLIVDQEYEYDDSDY